jgi:serine/threonine protein kinase
MDIYEFQKVIGNGMFGQVFLAKHKLEQKLYAIKRINFKDINKKDIENIENEVGVLQELKHPNVVSYKDSFFDKDNYFYIVMIYCEGGDFYEKIKNAKGKYFKEEEIIEWIVQLGLALSYVHDKKILHRDFKTQNIFLKDGRIRIGDFGIAKIFNQTKDLAGSMVGTPLYMSPELYNGKKYGFKSDIWSFGCCLYEMCNLKHAFEGLVR